VQLLGVGIALRALARAARYNEWTSDGYVDAGGSHLSDCDGNATDSSGSTGRRLSAGAETTITDDFVIAIQGIATIDPHSMLFIFLPPLLFESANAIDFHVFKRVLGKALILAFPLMFVGVALMGAIIKGLYGWRWSACLLLGAISSATDPVAVVAMLRELGAPVSLSTTIEGESLLNDGTAVVFYVLLKEIVEAGEVTKSGGEMLWDFIRMAGIGPAIGWTWGFLSLLWIRRVFNDRLVEIAIPLTSAYLSFYVSEIYCKSSGVLTVVALGLSYASTLGRTCISPEVHRIA
jgi:NhaP-type Na+/H+ or K+/H+ antiporter